MASNFGSPQMAAHDRLYDIPALPGFIAERDGEWVGNLAYEVDGPALEIAWIGTLPRQAGVGSALIAAAAAEARSRDLTRIWLITTNDNLDALRFYQRRGFRITAVDHDAANRARQQLKPEIPTVGAYEIPVHDEIHLELPNGEWEDVIARYSWPAA
jgi:RimJ/RimL family protein N-acetyltransferase